MHAGQTVFNGRFRCDRLVKTGRGVETWLATNRSAGRRGQQVVLKQVSVADPLGGVAGRLKHEAEVLQRLGPSLVELWEEDDSIYLVRPFVPGITLEARLAGGPLSVSSTLGVGIAVLTALQDAHDLEVLHRDVKPANVVVDEDEEPLTGATLIDFGFSYSSSLDASIRDQRVGTVRYIAPEAAGLLAVDIDERSDLYSFGILLFECLAGHPPFSGADLGKVLQQHLSAPSPRLRSLDVDVPRALDEAVQRLLRKDPAERYQTAGAVIEDLTAIAEALRRGVREPNVVIGLHDRRHALAEPAFVARSEELKLLAGLLDRAGSGRGGLVLLEAESGGGKTRLLDELANQTQPQAWILRGQGVDEVARRPFQLLEGLVAGIVVACRAHPGMAEDLRRHVGDQAAAVVSTLPEMAKVLTDNSQPGDASSQGPEAYGETRAVNALRSLLDGLGALASPPLILLDDCQWADGSTVRLLSAWQDDVADRGTRVVVIAAFRPEGVPADHPLRAIRRLATMTLAPLGAGDVRSLAESMAGELPPEALDAVGSLSAGSPFMASAVLRGLVESGALIEGPSGWALDPERLADVQTSRQAALFLTRRLELLAPATLDLLSAGAVLGKEFDVALAIELCQLDSASAATGLAEAGARRIIWVDEQAGRARLLHDKLREALLSRMDVDRRRELHRRVADRLEATDAEQVFELAYHLDAAGEGRRLVPYAIRAAEMARAQHSLDVAEVHYRMAWRGTQDTGTTAADAATRKLVNEGLGDVLTLEGSYDEATVHLEMALSLAVTDPERAALEGRLGDVAFKRGDQRLAREHLERGVRQLGRRLPVRAPAMVLALLVEVVVQVAHSLLPGVFLARRSRTGADQEFLAIRLYSRLAYVYWFSAGKVPCAWAHLREMNLAERYPASPELAQAYSEHAPVMTMAPWFARGIAYARKSLVIRQTLGDRWGQGQSLNFYGVALYAASRYRECIEKCSEAVVLLDQTGDRWEANTASWNIAFAHYRLGELTQSVSASRAVYVTARDIGDDTAAGISLSGWSRASEGRVPPELVRAQLEHRNGDAHTGAEVHVAEAVRLLAESRPAEAAAVLEAAALIVRKAGLRQEYVAPVLPWLASARRAEAEATSPYDTVARATALRSARLAARRGARMARWYRNNLPHALREVALVAALRGDHRRAGRLLERSLAVAATQDAAYEHALTRRAYGRLGYSIGATPPDQVVEQAEADLRSLVPTDDDDEDGRAGASLSVVDRFVTLLEVGRHIVAAHSPQAVYDAAREATMTLLRGEQCRIVDLGWDDGVNTSSGSIEPMSRTLVRRALDSGRPAVLPVPGAADSADSIVLSGLRSALCAPIFCEGVAVAFLYVTHSHVAGLFGDEEVQLTEFVATLAGATLERVAGTEARFRSLAQNSSDVITIVDRDATIVYQSSAVSRVFGLEPAAMLGRPLADWLHPDDVTDVVDTLTSVVRDGEDVRLIECRLLHHDGSWRDVETAVSNLVDDPSVNGIVLNSRDVSDRKVAERDLRETLDREHDMRERLQELDKIKTDFVSSVSHELRTPMTSILGYLEMLADGHGGALAPEQLRLLGIVDRNAQRLLVLIEELLIMSKVESGTFRLSLGPVEIGALLDGALQAVLPGLTGRDLDLQVDVAPDADTITGDAGQLDRVMINLLSNAMKFTPDGGRVSVSAAREEEAIVIRVTDTGMGIPLADQPRIFERFFRSSATQHLAVPGTGLGLSITKAIVEEHGGRLSVSSQPGEGTQVTVWLPLTPQPATVSV